MNQSSFTAAETETLRAVVAMIIPASEEHGQPGADDPAIFADILASTGRQHQALGEALAALQALARAEGGNDFAALEEAARAAVVESFRRDHRAQADRLATLAVQCYYRDDRVMRALGMAPRPPFPDGFEVPEGDWSLLDPVRARPAFYRKTPD
jgi:hypothetical protein